MGIVKIVMNHAILVLIQERIIAMNVLVDMKMFKEVVYANAMITSIEIICLFVLIVLMRVMDALGKVIANVMNAMKDMC